MTRYIFLYCWVNLVCGFKECSSGSDTAKPTVEYLVTPFFPHRTPRALKCKYSLSVNYGEYIKLVPDVLELPCAGQNGVYVEEAGGRSGPFCGNKRMPAFVSRDVKFDIHILIDTPLRGARIKIGYKSVTNPKGINIAKVRGSGGPKMPVALLKMAADQGQGALQQQNVQNIQNDLLNSQQEVAMQPPSRGFGKHNGPGQSRQGYDPNKRWASDTYNPSNDYPAYPPPGDKSKVKKSGAGVELVLPVLFLMILIGVLILVIHKRRQRMKAELKKLEPSEPIKRDFIPIEQSTMVKSEPTIEQINRVIEATNNAAPIENNVSEASPTKKMVSVPTNKVSAPSSTKLTDTMTSDKLITPTPANTLVAPQNIANEPTECTEQTKAPSRHAKKVIAAPTNKIETKTVSTDSAVSTKSKDSQATTAPSIRSEIKSECPRPTRPIRAPAARPTRKAPVDEDRPCY